MTVCLVERDDFAAGTSFNSLKTLHGGIRELQQGALSRVRQFVRERREIARLAPHLVRVLPFVIPTSRRHPRPLMRAFLAGYDLVARDRNEGVDPSQRLPASRVMSRAECLDLNPLIDARGVTGGALWHDYQLHSPERLAIALVESMVRREAAVINYTEILAVLRGAHAVSGVRVRDRLSGEAFDIRAPLVINAAGPWASENPPPQRREPAAGPAARLVAGDEPGRRPAAALRRRGRPHGGTVSLHGPVARRTRLRARVTGRRRPKGGPHPSASARSMRSWQKSKPRFRTPTSAATASAWFTAGSCQPLRAAATVWLCSRTASCTITHGRRLQGVADSRGRSLHDGRSHGQGGGGAGRPWWSTSPSDADSRRLPAADMGDLNQFVHEQTSSAEPTRSCCAG